MFIASATPKARPIASPHHGPGWIVVCALRPSGRIARAGKPNGLSGYDDDALPEPEKVATPQPAARKRASLDEMLKDFLVDPD